jgi:hypothetical protein
LTPNFSKWCLLIAFICVLEPVRQRKKKFSIEKHNIFLFQVFDLRFFRQIFILQQCLDPNPNFFSGSDPAKTFGFFRIRIHNTVPEGGILARQLTAMRCIGVGAALAPLPRIARRTQAAARRERLVVEDVIEIAEAQTAVVRSVGVHVVNVRHVEAKAEVVVGRGLLVVVEGGLRGLKNGKNFTDVRPKNIKSNFKMFLKQTYQTC